MAGQSSSGLVHCAQVENMEAQHRELLQTQLGTLRKELLDRAGVLPVNGHAEVLQLSLPPGVEEGQDTGAVSISFLTQDQTGGPDGQPPALTGLEIVEVQLQPSQVEPESKMESPVSDTPPVYSVEVLEGEQDVLLVNKRSPEPEPQLEENAKKQRTT